MGRISRAGIDQLLVSEAKRNIDKSIEADGEPMAPLWADGVPGHYRSGGKPLLDTRNTIYNRLHGKTQVEGRKARFILRGPLVAIYHNSGFETKGPNFIPLTRKARREHVPGADPASEKLVEGKDYIMAWAGVKVPRRRFFDAISDPLRERVREAVVAAIKGI